MSTPTDDGFSLVEVVIALLVLATAVVATAGLFVLAGTSVRTARARTWASLLAMDKVEEIRACPWGAGVGVDYLDASGRSVDGGSQPPASAVYVRRWSVQPLPAAPGDAMVVQVVVTTVAASRTAAAGLFRRHPGDAFVMTIRGRRDR